MRRSIDKHFAVLRQAALPLALAAGLCAASCDPVPNSSPERLSARGPGLAHSGRSFLARPLCAARSLEQTAPGSRYDVIFRLAGLGPGPERVPGRAKGVR